jgi:uncharacterized membrane protein YbhN (UPF0104 family)
VEGEPETTPTRVLAARPSRGLQVIGAVVTAAALAFCAHAIVDAWPEVRHSLVHASAGWLAAALACSAAAMSGLGLLWWRCLRLFGTRVRALPALAWHFGGELGKYIPGGIWAVLGRGEFARRGADVNRGTAYATTLISYACMTVAAAVVCGALAPFSHSTVLGWEWALLLLVPAGVAAAHPAVLGRGLVLGRRLSGGRVDLTAPRWSSMLRLIAWAIPTWLLVGTAAVMVTEALGFDQRPARVALAAVAAWIVGFLAVPVPAGAGVREVVFVVLCGLSAGPATAVAVIARALLLVVDGVGGLAGLSYAGRAATARDRA